MRLIQFIIILSLFIVEYKAQDVHFSQFGQTPQLINPGATGVFEGDFRGFLNYRTQWSGIGSGFKTYAASFDAPIARGKGATRRKKAYLGVGINFYTDVAGASNFRSTLTGISIAGILPLAPQHTFSLGIQTAMGQYSANLRSLTWGSQFDGEAFDTELSHNEYIGFKNTQHLDLGAGIFYEFHPNSSSFSGINNVSSFNVGVAGYHLNQPTLEVINRTNSQLPLKIVGQFSGIFDIPSSFFSIVPSFFYAYQNAAQEITPGILLKIKRGYDTKYTGLIKKGAIYLGAHVRVGDAIIPELYLEFTDYMIGFSYDYSNSDLAKALGGANSVEISIRYIRQKRAIQSASF